MSKKLIIAEKRDAGQTIAKVITNVWGEHFTAKKGYMEAERYVVSWCAGHLISLAPPESYDASLKKWSIETLPIIPAKMQYALIESTKEQYEILKMLLDRKDIVGVINAADAGREGELIFRLIYNFAGCNKPVKRLWASTTAAVDIKNALLSMKPGEEYDSLYFAAQCRSVQDWLIGINATRKYTCEYGQKLTIGRVQTPTLALVVKRDREIDGFVKHYLYKIGFTDNKGTKFLTKAYETESDAQTALARCTGKDIHVEEISIQTKRVKPPMLYSTTELQKDAAKYLGLSPKETLDIMQKLYDHHILSYPRTDACVISAAQESEFLKHIETIVSEYKWPAPSCWNVKRLVDDGKITDHPAVTITKEFTLQKRNDCNELEKRIIDLVTNRMVCCASEDYIYEATRVSAICENIEFESKGIKTIQEGWRQYRKIISNFAPDVILPLYKKGDAILPTDPLHIEQTETKPPAQYSLSTLLEAMEKAGKNELDADVERVGIGTSATRAEIIEKLVSTGYVEVKGKKNTVCSTAKGRALIDVMTKELREVDLTVEWENRMLAIRTAKPQDAKKMSKELMDETKSFVKKLIDEFVIDDSLKAAAQKDEQRESVGNCPICGAPVYQSKTGTSWYCSNFKKTGCSFSIWKDGQKGIYPTLKASKYTLTNNRIRTILEKGKTPLIKLTSAKTHKEMKAHIVLNEYAPGKYSLGFEF